MPQEIATPLYLERPTAADIQRHDLFQEMAEVTAAKLIEELAIADEKAYALGTAVAEYIATHWNGQNIYFTADRAYQLDKRDWEIFKKFRRGNALQLAKEYGLSYVRIYQIIAMCRKRIQQRGRELSDSSARPLTKQKLQSTPLAQKVADQAINTNPKKKA